MIYIENLNQDAYFNLALEEYLIKNYPLTDDILLFTDLFQDLDQIFLDLDKSEWQFWGRNNNDPNYRIGELSFIKKK